MYVVCINKKMKKKQGSEDRTLGALVWGVVEQSGFVLYY